MGLSLQTLNAINCSPCFYTSYTRKTVVFVLLVVLALSRRSSISCRTSNSGSPVTPYRNTTIPSTVYIVLLQFYGNSVNILLVRQNQPTRRLIANMPVQALGILDIKFREALVCNIRGWTGRDAGSAVVVVMLQQIKCSAAERKTIKYSTLNSEKYLGQSKRLFFSASNRQSTPTHCSIYSFPSSV